MSTWHTCRGKNRHAHAAGVAALTCQHGRRNGAKRDVPRAAGASLVSRSHIRSFISFFTIAQ